MNSLIVLALSSCFAACGGAGKNSSSELTPPQDTSTGQAIGSDNNEPVEDEGAQTEQVLDAPSNEREASQVALDIVSIPTDAEVTLDGQLIGRTPLQVRQLAAGEHTFEVSVPGYLPVTRVSELLPGSKHSESFMLSPYPSKTLQLGRALYDMKKYDSALIEFTKVIRGETLDSVDSKQQAEFFIAKTLYQKGDYTTSLARFNRIVESGVEGLYFAPTGNWLLALSRVLPESSGVLDALTKHKSMSVR